MKQTIKIFKHLEEELNTIKNFEVYSAFPNSINIILNGKMYVLQKVGHYLTPMSWICNISEENFEKLKTEIIHGMKIENNRLQVGELKFDILFIEKKLNLKRINENNIEYFFKILDENFGYKEYVGSLFKSFQIIIKKENNQSMKNILEKYFFYQLNHIISDDFEIQDIVNMLGAGEGLTPSGDDFICGYLAILFMLGKKSKINLFKESLAKKLYKTTKVSQEYLQYALNGEFNEYIKELNDICSEKNLYTYRDTINQIIEKVSRIGHSSGVDFLIGMYIGFIKEVK